MGSKKPADISLFFLQAKKPVFGEVSLQCFFNYFLQQLLVSAEVDRF